MATHFLDRERREGERGRGGAWVNCDRNLLAYIKKLSPSPLHPLSPASPVKRSLFVSAVVALTGLLTGCSGGTRLLDFPFDPGGRSLNSLASELTPQVAGRYIVFISDRRGSQDVYLYDTTTRSLIDLPGLNGLDAIASHPTVSEDGRSIVFAASRQGRSRIYLYNRETRQLRNLTETLQAEVRNPTISADGSTIAFESSENGRWGIVVYDRSGKPLNLP